MKRIIFLLVIVFVCSNLMAQTKEGVKRMSKGKNNSFTMKMVDGDLKAIQDEWTKFTKQYKGKTKKDRKSGEWFTDDADITGLSTNTVDLYASFVQNGDDVEMTVWCDLGGAYLKSDLHHESMPTMYKMLDEFDVRVKKNAIGVMIKNEESVLKKMNNEMTGLAKDKENLEDDITKFQKKIEEAKQKIEENILAQKMKSEEIKKQELQVELVKLSLKDL